MSKMPAFGGHLGSVVCLGCAIRQPQSARKPIAQRQSFGYRKFSTILMFCPKSPPSEYRSQRPLRDAATPANGGGL
jgi:hypothetical protein